MTLQSSGTISASDIGYEFGRVRGQSVSFSLSAPSGAVIRGVEPGTMAANGQTNFTYYWGKTSAKNLVNYSPSTTVVQVRANIDRILDWYVSFGDWSTRIYNATASGATFDATSFQNTLWPNGLEPLFTPSAYDSLYVETTGTTSSRGSTWVSQNVSVLQQPVSYTTPYGLAWATVVRGNDSGQPGQSTYSLNYRVYANNFSNKGGFYNPRIWFNRTVTGFNDNDTSTWYIPIKTDPDVSIQSISFSAVYSPNSNMGLQQALQVVSWDTGGVYVRNRRADGSIPDTYGYFDFDYRLSGTNVAACALRCNATLRYQNYNHNVSCDHFIHFLLIAYMFAPAGGGDNLG